MSAKKKTYSADFKAKVVDWSSDVCSSDLQIRDNPTESTGMEKAVFRKCLSSI